MLLYGSDPSPEAVLETSRFELPVDQGAVASARDHLSHTLTAWGWQHRTDTAVLCVSELTTALLAMDCRGLHLSISRRRDRVTVELQCRGAQQRFSEMLGGDPERARGIAVIDDQVALWGVRPADDGETIWFELR